MCDTFGAVAKGSDREVKIRMCAKTSAPCPHCRAENLAHRRKCWRCKRTLPTSFALDAELHSGPTFSSEEGEAYRPSHEDIEEALRQAIIIDGEEDNAPTREGDTLGKRLRWLFGKRSLA
jgi:hypothetical protein